MDMFLLSQVISRRYGASELAGMAAQAFERAEWPQVQDRLTERCLCLRAAASNPGNAKHWADAARLESESNEAWALLPR